MSQVSRLKIDALNHMQGYPEYMTVSEQAIRDYGQQAVGTSKSAMARLWQHAHQAAVAGVTGEPLLDPSREANGAPRLDDDLKVKLCCCTLCDHVCSSAVIGEHVRLCRQLHQLRGGVAPAGDDESGWFETSESSRHSQAYESAEQMLVQYAGSISSLNEAHGRGGRGSGQGRTEEWTKQHNALLEGYRARCFGSFSDHEREVSVAPYCARGATARDCERDAT